MAHTDGVWSLVSENWQRSQSQIENQDIFKLGRQVLQFLLFSSTNINQNLNLLFDRLFPESPTTKNDFDFISAFAGPDFEYESSLRSSHGSTNDQKSVCRICLEHERPAKQFARNICRCSNSMPVHAVCLLKYTRLRCRPITSKNYTYYDLNHTTCDLCKETYPKFLVVDQKKVPLLHFTTPNSRNFVAILVYQLETSKVRHLVFADLEFAFEKSMSVGRAGHCDIRFLDNSVSDFHARILFKSGRVFMLNVDQKFGTLKKITKRLKMEQVDNKVLVIGKCSIMFHVITPNQSCACLKKLRAEIIEDPFHEESNLVNADQFMANKNQEIINNKKLILKNFHLTQNNLDDLLPVNDVNLIINPSMKYPKTNLLRVCGSLKINTGEVLQEFNKIPKIANMPKTEYRQSIEEFIDVNTSRFKVENSLKKINNSRIKRMIQTKIEERENCVGNRQSKPITDSSFQSLFGKSTTSVVVNQTHQNLMRLKNEGRRLRVPSGLFIEDTEPNKYHFTELGDSQMYTSSAWMYNFN